MYLYQNRTVCSALPQTGKALFKVINHTVELILFFYLLPFSWRYLNLAIATGQTSPALGIPMYLVQAAPLAGFLLAAVRILQRWVIEWKTVWRKE